MGANNTAIRRIFLLNASNIIVRGMLWGNIIGIGLCFLQQQFGLIKLPEESYYVSVAPVQLDWVWILMLNLGTFLVSIIFLIIPSLFVSSIRPIKAIRFN